VFWVKIIVLIVIAVAASTKGPPSGVCLQYRRENNFANVSILNHSGWMIGFRGRQGEVVEASLASITADFVLYVGGAVVAVPIRRG
jgi:hypothetical protein